MFTPDQRAWANRANGATAGQRHPAAALPSTINGEETWSEIVDLEATVRLTRLGFLVAFVAQLVYLAVNYIELDSRVMSATAWYDVFIITASILATAATFTPVFIDYWRGITLGLCLSLLAGWTCLSVIANQQVQLFTATILLVMGMGSLAPWEIGWQAALTSAGVGSCLVSAALVHPAVIQPAYLWLYLLTASALVIASNRLWARWREAVKKADRRLRSSEERLRAVLDANLDPTSVIRVSDGRFVYVNAGFLKAGYKREEVLGKSVRELATWADERVNLGEFIDQVRTRGFVGNQEVNLRLGDGTVVPHLLSSVIVDLDGQQYILSVARNVAALKQVECDLKRAVAELNETQHKLIAAREAALAASRAKSEFLSSMSHEIRTPLNAILGMAELMAENPLPPEQRRYVETMTSNGNALLDLINGILDLAKVESGRLRLEETEFDLDELVERAVETLGVRAHEKGIELLTNIAPDVPLKLVGDPLRLRQVLINLIGNAIKFTEHGEVVVAVERCDRCSNEEPLRFSVRDSGIGIAPDKLNDIFQSFTQADSSVTRRYGGSGLGLAIARRLVELMGGQIGVESKRGAGSVFYFTARLRPGRSPGTHLVEPRSLADLRVLLVDDNETGRSILRQFLTSRGAEVDEAASAKQALAQIERANGANPPYQLLLLDCAMPEMDGFQLADRLKRQGHGTQKIVMMLTAENLSAKLLRLREMGLAFYVVKPIKCSEMIQTIGASIGRPRLAYRKPSPPESAGDAVDRRPLRILLAEDSPDNRQLIEAYLKNFPYQLEAVENGDLALERFKQREYDLVLMDMQMPVMDGYTATRAIRRWEHEQNRPPTAIVALTASALEEDVRNTLEAGCTAHLSKPVKKGRLLTLIGELMSATPASPTSGDHPRLSAATARDQKTL